MTTTVLVAPVDSMEAQCAARALGAAGAVATTEPSPDVDAVLCFVVPGEVPYPEADPSLREQPLLVVCPRIDGAARRLATEVGAAGLVAWQTPTSDVLDAIEGLLAGESQLSFAAKSDPLEALTDREMQIVGLLGEGASNEAIAGALGISYHTVRTHVAHVLAKLGVSHRYAVVSMICQSARFAVPTAGTTAGGGSP